MADIFVRLGVPAKVQSIVAALRKQLTIDIPVNEGQANDVQVILDEGGGGGGGGRHIRHEVTALASNSGPEAAAMMKIGARVARGPDWKWGDQVYI